MAELRRENMLVDGKTKQLFKIDNDEQLAIRFKDDALTFYGIKKANIPNKGIIVARINEILFSYLNANGVPTHFEGSLGEDAFLCKKTLAFPIGLVVRNISSGKFADKFLVSEGKALKKPVFEICYFNEKLGNPIINDSQAVALGLFKERDLKVIYKIAKKANTLLKNFFLEKGLLLVDFKLHFGALGNEIILIDELSPDIARIWDKKTKKRLDKDVLKLDLGDLKKSYSEILDRIKE